jgi:Ca-activated chloride channel homolog
LSDGGGNASQQKFSQVLAQAQRSQVTIYSIGVVDPDEEVNPAVLRRLSKETGGLAFLPMSLENVADISKRIARDLREQYTLGFVPEKTDARGAFRRLKVKVAAPGHGKCVVRTRSGYFAAEKSLPGQVAKDSQ